MCPKPDLSGQAGTYYLLSDMSGQFRTKEHKMDKEAVKRTYLAKAAIPNFWVNLGLVVIMLITVYFGR